VPQVIHHSVTECSHVALILLSGGRQPGAPQRDDGGPMRAPWSMIVATLGTAGMAMGGLAATPASAAVPVRGTFTPVDPVRVLDTRDGTGVAGHHPGPLGAGQVTELTVTGVGGVPTTGVGAVVLNVTATEAPGPGYVTVYPCGQARPLASNLNFTHGVNVASQVTVKVGDDGRACFFAYSQVQIVADLFGWYADDFAAVPGFHYHPLDPARILDTRDGTGLDGRPAGPLAAGQVLALEVKGAGGVPDDGSARAVTLNVTVAGAEGPGYLTVFPCDRPRPGSSNINVDPSQPTVANLVTIRVDPAGQVCIFASVGTDVVADVQGYFSPAPGVDFTATEPVRVLDTRDGTGVVGHHDGPLGRGEVFALHVVGTNGVPDDARAVLLDVTVTEAQGPGFVSVYPCGRPRPLISNLNFLRGIDRSNLVKARIGVDGNVCFFVFEGTQLVADLDGWYTPTPAAA